MSRIAALTIIPSGVSTPFLMDRRQNLTDPASPLVPRPALRRMIGSVRRVRLGAKRRPRSASGDDPVGPAVYRLVIAVVVVGLGHVTHRMHIFHESHVPSQQT